MIRIGHKCFISGLCKEVCSDAIPVARHKVLRVKGA